MLCPGAFADKDLTRSQAFENRRYKENKLTKKRMTILVFGYLAIRMFFITSCANTPPPSDTPDEPLDSGQATENFEIGEIPTFEIPYYIPEVPMPDPSTSPLTQADRDRLDSILDELTRYTDVIVELQDTAAEIDYESLALTPSRDIEPAVLHYGENPTEPVPGMDMNTVYAKWNDQEILYSEYWRAYNTSILQQGMMGQVESRPPEFILTLRFNAVRMDLDYMYVESVAEDMGISVTDEELDEMIGQFRQAMLEPDQVDDDQAFNDALQSVDPNMTLESFESDAYKSMLMNKYVQSFSNQSDQYAYQTALTAAQLENDIVINDPEVRAMLHVVHEAWGLAGADYMDALASISGSGGNAFVLESRIRYLLGILWGTRAFNMEMAWLMQSQQNSQDNVPDEIRTNQQGFFVLALLNLDRSIELYESTPWSHLQRARINLVRNQLKPQMVDDIETAYLNSNLYLELSFEILDVVERTIELDDELLEANGGTRPETWADFSLPEDDMGLTLDALDAPFSELIEPSRTITKLSDFNIEDYAPEQHLSAVQDESVINSTDEN